MTKSEADFESWFDLLRMHLGEAGIQFSNADSVRGDYEAGRDLFDVVAEIRRAYEYAQRQHELTLKRMEGGLLGRIFGENL